MLVLVVVIFQTIICSTGGCPETTTIFTYQNPYAASSAPDLMSSIALQHQLLALQQHQQSSRIESNDYEKIEQANQHRRHMMLLEKLNREMNNTFLQKITEYDNKITEILVEKAKLQSQKKKNHSKICQLQAEIDRLNAKKEKLSMRMEDFNYDNSSENQEINRIKKEIQELTEKYRSKFASIDAEVNGNKRRREILNGDLEKSETRIMDLEQELMEVKAKKDELGGKSINSSNLDRLKIKAGNLKRNVANLERQIKFKTDESKKLTNEINKVRRNIENLKKSIASIEKRKKGVDSMLKD